MQEAAKVAGPARNRMRRATIVMQEDARAWGRTAYDGDALLRRMRRSTHPAMQHMPCAAVLRHVRPRVGPPDLR